MKTPLFDFRRALASGLMLLGVVAGSGGLLLPTMAQAADATVPQRARGKPATPQAVAIRHVNDAVLVAKKMRAEPRIAGLLADAKGVFLMPKYVRAAVGVGGGGGPGVLLVRNEAGEWSDPAFFHVGSVSVGVQVGVQAGPMALILNNEKAVSHFSKQSNFALSADSGLTVVNWVALGTAGPGDVTAWSGGKGLFGNAAAVSLSDVRYSVDQTSGYYARQGVSLDDVIKGVVKNPQAEPLKQALAPQAAKVPPHAKSDVSAK